MSDTFDPPTPHRRPPSPPLAVAYLEFDLAREIGQLHREPEWENGKNAKTLVKYHDFHVVLTTLRARARMPGNLLTLDRGLPHDVEALEDSALLLTIAWPGR
ncbi:MAG: hypothetical protein ABI603_00730 [Acidobacteriota bacterium]